MVGPPRQRHPQLWLAVTFGLDIAQCVSLTPLPAPTAPHRPAGGADTELDAACLKIPQKSCVFSMTSPGTKGAASCLATMGINPITPTKPPLTPAELAERKERSDQRKRIRAAAPGAEAADQELAATEMTLAVPEAAAQLKANAKKARVDRTAATADAVARSRLEEATPPLLLRPVCSPREGKLQPSPGRSGSRRRRSSPKLCQTIRTQSRVQIRWQTRRPQPESQRKRWAIPLTPQQTTLLTPSHSKPPQTTLTCTQHKPHTTKL